MTIQTISKEDKNVTVELSADDLVVICNALYLHSKEQDLQSKEQKTNDHFFQLYSDMMIARDLCQYGHVDNFCLRNVVACRNDIGKKDRCRVVRRRRVNYFSVRRLQQSLFQVITEYCRSDRSIII